MPDGPDLHVESLTYRLIPTENIIYEGPQAIEFDTEHANIRLADGELRCSMKTDYSNPGDARAVIDPVLRSWEVASDLKSNKGALRFKYDTANVVDRSPPIPGQIRGHAIMVQSIGSLEAFGNVTVRINLKQYPLAPGSFRLTPDAETLWLRYTGYTEGKEPLPSMAYFCLTMARAISGGVAAASKKYQIRERVLRKLSELTSVRGDRLTARKASSRTLTPLTGTEIVWIESVIKLLILRIGTDQTREILPWIDFSDLPGSLYRA